jgi:peptidoglycan/LPS O-acetylase OafA/YrhL
MKFSNIQILRALAAGLVVYVHALETYSLRIGNINESLTLDLGDLGVKLFFLHQRLHHLQFLLEATRRFSVFS